MIFEEFFKQEEEEEDEEEFGLFKKYGMLVSN
jgi:hypothetical protein